MSKSITGLSVAFLTVTRPKRLSPARSMLVICAAAPSCARRWTVKGDRSTVAQPASMTATMAAKMLEEPATQHCMAHTLLWSYGNPSLAVVGEIKKGLRFADPFAVHFARPAISAMSLTRMMMPPTVSTSQNAARFVGTTRSIPPERNDRAKWPKRDGIRKRKATAIAKRTTLKRIHFRIFITESNHACCAIDRVQNNCENL